MSQEERQHMVCDGGVLLGATATEPLKASSGGGSPTSIFLLVATCSQQVGRGWLRSRLRNPRTAADRGRLTHRCHWGSIYRLLIRLFTTNCNILEHVKNNKYIFAPLPKNCMVHRLFAHC